MFRFSKNNGMTEGFHRKMKLIQQRVYGFRDVENYHLCVRALCGQPEANTVGMTAPKILCPRFEVEP